MLIKPAGPANLFRIITRPATRRANIGTGIAMPHYTDGRQIVLKPNINRNQLIATRAAIDTLPAPYAIVIGF